MVFDVTFSRLSKRRSYSTRVPTIPPRCLAQQPQRGPPPLSQSVHMLTVDIDSSTWVCKKDIHIGNLTNTISLHISPFPRPHDIPNPSFPTHHVPSSHPPSNLSPTATSTGHTSYRPATFVRGKTNGGDSIASMSACSFPLEKDVFIRETGMSWCCCSDDGSSV